ncbi:MAG: amidohydrolase [Caldilineaceae bacterium]|nr:amidohydrolase [Caldilineaceae bacterium]
MPQSIFYNGNIYTLDSENSMVQALAVRDGRILATGADGEILRLAHDQTRLVDLRGHAVIPGIFDSHIHVLQIGVKLTRIRLDECRSPGEMAELVHARAQETPPGQWIIGEGWNEARFDAARLPTRADIDWATDRHPVMLQRFFNTDLVNSVALRLAGITRHTLDPHQGRIEKDADGEPNGLIRAGAKPLVRDLLPQPTRDELVAAFRLAQEELHSFGITSALDPGLYPWEMRAYAAAYRQDQLRLRMNIMPSWHGFHEDETEAQLNARARELGVNSGLGDEWLRLGGLKMAIDGGTSPHTAFMYEPFEGESVVHDFNRLSTDNLLAYFGAAQELGWDVGIHVCGDRALDMVTAAFAQVARDIPWPDARHSAIHAYFPSPEALARMAKHNIAAVIQSTFLYWEGDDIFRDVGRYRAANYKPARAYLDHGVRVMASSDAPSTVSANPFPALYALVTRKNNLGHTVAPDQALTREEALRAYTINGAWLTREERLKGTLEPGKVADFAVLDRDYFTVAQEEIKEICPLMTVLDGLAVFEA